MAGSLRTEDPPVESSGVLALLRDEPWSFGFFQAVRLLERAEPGRAAVGRFADPAAEVVRFLQYPSLSFPASEIQDLQWPEGRRPVRMFVNFIGLIGTQGVLPLHYTELAMDRLRARDRSYIEFLNIFEHRLTSAFYRVWEKHHFAISYERDQNDQFTGRIYDLIGLGTPGLRNQQTVRDEGLAFYAGLLALHARSAVSLESLLSDYFDVPVRVEQFVGCWRKLDECDQCQFESDFLGATCLGGGAVVGDEVWDRQSRARIVMGPLSGKRYREFLPNGSAYAPLRDLTRFFSGDDIEYEIQLILTREHVAGCELGCDEDAGVQLGWFTWIKSQQSFTRDPGDTVLLLA